MDPMMGGGGYTPEQLQALMEYAVGQGAFTEQDREVQRQMAAARALRDQQSQRHTTGIGGGLGAIGDTLSSISGAQQMGQARQQDVALQQERIKALRALAARYQPQQAQPDPTQGIPPMLARPPGM